MSEPIPQDGIHDVASDIYHGWKLPSNSRLSALKRSPAHCRCEMDTPSSPTAAMKTGTALHAAILEPDAFARDYGVLPEGDGRTKAVKDARAALAEQFGDRVLTAEEHAACCAIRESVWAHPRARSILESRDATEISGVWTDPETGVRMKMRTDLLHGGAGIIGDLKSTQDASRGAFERSIFNFGYYRQGAIYTDGWAKLGRQYEHFVIIAFEKTPPYAVAVYRLADEVLQAGYDEYRRLIASYAECERNGRWPAYGDAVEDIGLPSWAWRDFERNGE